MKKGKIPLLIISIIATSVVVLNNIVSLYTNFIQPTPKWRIIIGFLLVIGITTSYYAYNKWKAN